MIRNLFKTIWRQLSQSKPFGIINTVGLALAMTCCLLIFLWIQHERRVDNFFYHGDRLFVAYQTLSDGNRVEGNYRTPLQYISTPEKSERIFLLEDAKDAVPEIQSVVFYATGYELPWGHPETLEANGKKNKLNGARASRDFFKVLDYPLLEGDAENALKEPHHMAISRAVATSYFGSVHQAMGQTLRYENRLDFMVSAVFEDIPSSSSLDFDFLLNWDAHNTILEWASPEFTTYVLLADNAHVPSVETKINQYIKPRLKEEKGVVTQIGLQPLKDRHLYGNFVKGKPETGRITYVRIFSGAALFILIIACINFALIATARSIKRSKEIGIRKVLGTSRLMLIVQFYLEALLLSVFALFITLFLISIILPFFALLSGAEIVQPFGQAQFWGTAAMLMVVTALLAGTYPAVFLSGLQPTKALKQRQLFSMKRGGLRRLLIVFQFSLSVLFLIATIVVSRQTRYTQALQLGYDRENLLYTRIEGELMEQSNYNLFKTLALDVPGVVMVDRASETPHAMRFVVDVADGVSNTSDGADAINWEGKQKSTTVGFKPVSVGYDFVTLMGLDIVEGRDFSRMNATDSASAFLVNEEAVRQMGMEEPLGKWVSAWQKKGYIIGVLKDYHTYSLHEPIKPLVVDVKEYEYFGVILIRIDGGKTQQALEGLGHIYSTINPDFPFDYQFVDAEYQNFYTNEQVMARLVTAFTSLAIVISCLGLLGLVVFSVEQRTKEIGIRKVLGASVASIVGMLSKDFVKLVLIAACIASPIAWWAMDHWLANFAYHIAVEWWMFAVAGLTVVIIALVTLSWQAIRVAVANPVRSLQEE
ncbi:ABC transporter permease [Parapedobacter koreensis]|uniref:FtsX-like permease family protein n=1 Tax=Parapedobacter koreensis TaxID=332977 RepID=A0A1H7MJU5_9SPHI|nr:ABC transporter permease [Parapedobacter koreensis]SEL10877.1 FtsX-like permease family protein [Parapedobacter koreensis]